MPSPDLRSYIDLTLFDADIQDLYNNAIANLAVSLPEWIPREGNVETVLLEGFALQVSEALFAINRLPNSLMQILLQMFGVYRDFGTPPIANLEFTVVDDVGYTIPAGTQAMLVIADGITPVTFTTDTDLTIPAGSTTGTVSATADQFTADANGVANQQLSPVNSLLSVNSVLLVSITTPGRDQEDDTDWLNRGNQRLVQLSQALVLANQFQAAALEDVDVIRALALDNWDGTTTSGNVPGDNPGNVAVAVYGDGQVLDTATKASLLSSLDARSVANLGVHVIDANIQTVDVTASVSADLNYDNATVIANATAAIQDYLSYENWDWSSVVRRNTLIKVIGSADGVSYVVSLTEPAADVNANAPATLMVAGTVTVIVPTAPLFTASTPPGGTVSTAYSYTFTASGSPAPTFAVASGSLPAGLTLDSATGVLSGTPTTAGTSTFTVTASNGVAPDATTGTITVTIAA